MIVPQAKLIWLASVSLLPLITILFFFPAAAAALIALVLIIVVVISGDAIRSRSALAGVSAHLAKQVTLQKGRDGKLDVHIENKSQKGRVLRVGLNLPPSIKAECDYQLVELQSNVETSLFTWHCKPGIRGNFLLASVHLETCSRLGLWAIRKTCACESRISVYPDLVQDRKRLATAFFKGGALGAHARRVVGKGREFEKLRDYLPGDAVEDVHWKATAKRGKPVTKIFQIERTQELYVVVDCSRMSARPSHDSKEGVPVDYEVTTVLDRQISAALYMCLVAGEQSDHFGLITFSDKVHTLLKAKSGKLHLSTCKETLFNLQPRIVTPDFDELCSTIRVQVRKRSLIIFLTSLDDPMMAESFLKSIELVRRQHLVMVGMIEPGKVEPVFKSKVKDDAGVYDALAGHLIYQKLYQIQKTLQAKGVQFHVVPEAEFVTRLVSNYISLKQRQLL